MIAAVSMAAAGVRYAPSFLGPRVDAGHGASEEVRAPEDLLADAILPSPDASWSTLQRRIGGAASILPSTVPSLLVAMSDLDARLARAFDGSVPIVAAVAGDVADPSAAISVKLVDAKRGRAELTDAPDAPFSAKDIPGGVLLVPKRAVSTRHYELALTDDGFVFVLRHEADLAKLGTYLTRGLRARPMPTSTAVAITVAGSGLRRVAVPRLEAWWRDAKEFLETQDKRMRAERGRAPDFGDPQEILRVLDRRVTGAVATAGDLAHASIVLELPDDAVSLRAALAPRSAEGPAAAWRNGMSWSGDSAPLLGLPRTSTLAVSFAPGASAGSVLVKELMDDAKRMLGPRVKDASELDSLDDELRKAEVESLAVSLAVYKEKALYARASVRNVQAAEKAMQHATRLAEAEPFKGLFRATEFTRSTESASGLGPVTMLRIRPASPSESFGVAWLSEPGLLTIGAGASPIEVLRGGREPQATLARDPHLVRFVQRSPAGFVIVAQPFGSEQGSSNVLSPSIALALGRAGEDAVVRIDVTNAALRELVRRAAGF